MLNEIYSNQKATSQKSIESLKRDFMGIRSGKVSINILDNIRVDYYGNPTPLNQVASVLATDAVTISVTPWEKPMLKTIESAIAAANIGVNPNNDGESVKPFFPPMTTEQRIMALVRLGVNESAEIANLLFYSPQTIYNYRSAIKAKAILKESFESEVAKLCTVIG